MGEYHRNKRKLSSASVFFGCYREKWEDRSEHTAVAPGASHLTSQQFPCSDAFWLQHSPGPSAGGALPGQWIWMLLSLSRQLRSLGHVLKIAQTQGTELPSHCCSELLKYSPSCVAAPAAGWGSLTLGCIGPIPQSCWQWTLVFLLGFLSCFLSPCAVISSCYSNWHCLCIKWNSPSQFWWKNVEEGILFGEIGCIKEK